MLTEWQNSLTNKPKTFVHNKTYTKYLYTYCCMLTKYLWIGIYRGIRKTKTNTIQDEKRDENKRRWQKKRTTDSRMIYDSTFSNLNLWIIIIFCLLNVEHNTGNGFENHSRIIRLNICILKRKSNWKLYPISSSFAMTKIQFISHLLFSH